MGKNKNIKSTKKNKKENKKKHKFLLAFFMIIFIAIFIAIIIGSAIFVANFKVAKDEFDINDLVIGDSNSTILDLDGNVLATLNGEEKRKIISITEMSPYLPKAYVAIEDERFYQHSGIDFKRTGHAILNFVTKRGSTSFGGSTITQQLVKNATDDKEKTITRKLKEWARAYKVEEVLSKDQILETYLNIIFVGQDYYGVELGAHYYFSKSAKDLSLAECAFMAGINNSPNLYKPFAEDPDGKYMDRIKTRTKTVLGKMKELSYITEEEYKNAITEVENGLAFSKGETPGNVYSYHTDALLIQLVEDVMKEKQISKELATSYVYGGGLTIYSTQNTSIQNIVNEEVKKDKYKLKSYKYEGTYAEAAVVVMDEVTGYVLACSGGLGEKTESRGLNRATQSKRQTGSAFKPLVAVAPGLQEKVITPSSKEFTDEFTVFPGNYKPKNYNYFRGSITIRQALETSQNIPFIKVVQKLTVPKAKEYLEKMGITSLTDKDSGLSIAIGGLNKGVSPLEMCGAYATISNDGKYNRPKFYYKVVDSKGNVVIEQNPENIKVFDENVAYVAKTLIQEPVKGASGTATYCALPNIDVAAKTGTTNNDNDRWLCGFTPYYTCVAWYGYDKEEEIHYSGTNPAGQLFDGVMTVLHQDLGERHFEEPSGVVSALVCRETGLCASETCGDVYTEKFVAGTVPGVCGGHIIEPEEPEVEVTEIVDEEAKKKEEEEKKKAEEEKKKEEEAKKKAEEEKKKAEDAKKKAEEEANKAAEEAAKKAEEAKKAAEEAAKKAAEEAAKKAAEEAARKAAEDEAKKQAEQKNNAEGDTVPADANPTEADPQ